MDGTLTDSISAVEAAWGKVAEDIGQDPEYVIAATHGKRAIDNLRQLRPTLARANTEEMNNQVQGFEESILFYADAYNKHGPGSRKNSFANTPLSSEPETPGLTPGTSAPSSRASSIAPANRTGSFVSRLRSLLTLTGMSEGTVGTVNGSESAVEDDYDQDGIVQSESNKTLKDRSLDDQAGSQDNMPATEEEIRRHKLEAWQVEACAVDRSVKILPGVQKMMKSIPEGRYAVATSGAKTYAYGCMTRVGITPPPITITADDKRLKAGKPAPDPFLLAAECLGYDAKRCVVFEDSPSGIRAGVASGAIVIAVCTSHEREKIEGCGAHYIVENMENVKCEFDEAEGRLKFTVMM
ncbi:hypothetical protein PQX77_006540 [Marasmius sp. AFHP31]|nr:hypothetical protein PQX77_006540 [Marasmius sp. AFHP31]